MCACSYLRGFLALAQDQLNGICGRDIVGIALHSAVEADAHHRVGSDKAFLIGDRRRDAVLCEQGECLVLCLIHKARYGDAPCIGIGHRLRYRLCDRFCICFGWGFCRVGGDHHVAFRYGMSVRGIVWLRCPVTCAKERKAQENE